MLLENVVCCILVLVGKAGVVAYMIAWVSLDSGTASVPGRIGDPLSPAWEKRVLE